MLARARSCSKVSCSSGLGRRESTCLAMSSTLREQAGKLFASLAQIRVRGARFRDVDTTDRKILAELQADGRLTLTDLADRVNLSISRCQRRVRDLEAQGAIRGYRAVIDPAAVGLGFEVLV